MCICDNKRRPVWHIVFRPRVFNISASAIARPFLDAVESSVWSKQAEWLTRQLFLRRYSLAPILSLRRQLLRWCDQSLLITQYTPMHPYRKKLTPRLFCAVLLPAWETTLSIVRFPNLIMCSKPSYRMAQKSKPVSRRRRRNLFATNNNNIKQEKHNMKVSS